MTATPPIPERLRWTVELIDVRPTDHLLEVGCGSGHAVALVCERLSRGTITAIDRSPIMVARARERNQGCISAGRARVEQRTLVDATFARRFRTIFAVNVNAFWTAPAPSLAAVKRLLLPEGTAFLTYEPPTAKGSRDMRGWLPSRLDENGFTVGEVREERFAKAYGLCIIGRFR